MSSDLMVGISLVLGCPAIDTRSHTTPTPVRGHDCRPRESRKKSAATSRHFTMTGRLDVVTKDAKALVPGRKTFFDLSGELRNQIYDLALDKQYQRVPLNPYYLNKPDPYIALLQTCSQIYKEARSYLVEKQVAYVPVMAGMQYDYGTELSEDYGLSKETTDTIAASLTDFMEVQFHLHIDILRVSINRRWDGSDDFRLNDANGEKWNIVALLDTLHQAIKNYTPHSWNLYLEHELGKRRATVHLDHLLSLWPRISPEHPCVPIAAMRDLVDLMAKDTMTEWQIRYYIPTGQAGVSIRYGCTMDDDMAHAIRDTELAQLRSYAKTCGHDNVTIIAELYGENTAWEYGDKSDSVTRLRSPATDFWPNLHFDPWKYSMPHHQHWNRSYPGK